MTFLSESGGEATGPRYGQTGYTGVLRFPSPKIQDGVGGPATPAVAPTAQEGVGEVRGKEKCVLSKDRRLKIWRAAKVDERNVE